MMNYQEKIYNYIQNRKLIQLVTVKESRRHYNKIMKNATHREVAPDEIIIEFDTDNEILMKKLFKKTISRLNANSYNYFVFDHYGRSPHIHLYNFRGLLEQTDIVRSAYKKMFIERYAPYKEVDVSLNTTREHLVAFEFRKHYKYNTIKELIYTNTGIISNRLEVDILAKAYKEERQIIQEMMKRKDEGEKDYRWIVAWALSQPLPDGNRDKYVYKNIAIAIINHKLDDEPIVENLASLNSHKVRGQMSGWLSWAKNKKRTVSPSEIYKYCDEHDIDYFGTKKRWQTLLKI
ncbi:MAG: hypothetical protein ACQESN_08765 [Thermotogota bacterium]